VVDDIKKSGAMLTGASDDSEKALIDTRVHICNVGVCWALNRGRVNTFMSWKGRLFRIIT
jgi:hypothetical protein